MSGLRRHRGLVGLALLVALAWALVVAPLRAAPTAQAERVLDGRLPALGVTLHEAAVAPGQSYWRIVRVEWQDPDAARGRHHIDLEMLDEAGRRLVGAQARVSWEGGATTLTIENKPAPEYGSNFGMYSAGCAYSLEGMGLPSDRLSCLGLGTIEQRDWTHHTVFRVTMQRVVAGGSGGSATPTATAAPPGGWRIQEMRVHPNCGLTRLMGLVQDSTGRGLAGHRVEVTWDAANASVFATTTNSIGQWEIFLFPGEQSPGGRGWRVTALDERGQMLVSGYVATSAPGQHDCSPGGNARNVIELSIEPVPIPATATATRPPATATTRIGPSASPTATPLPLLPAVSYAGRVYVCAQPTAQPDDSLLLRCTRAP